MATPNPFRRLLAKDAQEKAIYIRPAASEAAIKEMQRQARCSLGAEVPYAYVRLLNLTNGLQINGAYFKEAENLVAENVDVQHPEILVLGDEGNMVWYVFDKRDKKFHVITLGCPDERQETYGTFDELLDAVLNSQIGES